MKISPGATNCSLTTGLSVASLRQGGFPFLSFPFLSSLERIITEMDAANRVVCTADADDVHVRLLDGYDAW